MANYVPTSWLGELMTKQVSIGVDTFKVALFTGTVPSTRDDTTSYYGGATFPTEATGTNYTAGGNSVTVTGGQYTTGGVHHYYAAIAAGSTSWTTVTLTSVTYAVLFDQSTATHFYAACVWDFGGAQSVTANTFTINFTDTTPTGRVFYLSA